jgi:hypothetical protein
LRFKRQVLLVRPKCRRWGPLVHFRIERVSWTFLSAQGLTRLHTLVKLGALAGQTLVSHEGRVGFGGERAQVLVGLAEAILGAMAYLPARRPANHVTILNCVIEVLAIKLVPSL